MTSFKSICLLISSLILIPRICSIQTNYNVSNFFPLEWQQGAASIFPGQPFSFTLKFFVGLISVPLIIAFIGICLLLSYQTSLCCRPCFRRCCPNRCTCLYVKDQTYLKADFNTRMKYHKWAIISFVVWLIITLIFTCFMIFPYQNLHQSLESTSNAIIVIYNFFTTILNDAQSISNNIGLVDNYVLDNPCYLAFQHYNITGRVLTETNLMQLAINNTIIKVGNIPKLLTDANNVINNNVQPVLIPIFWGYFAIVVTLVFAWSLVLILCRSKKFLTLMIILTEIVVLILSIVYAIEMYVVLMNASFCYPSPTSTVLNAFDSSDKVYETIRYYTTCKGTNPFGISIAQLLIGLATLQHTILRYTNQLTGYLISIGQDASCVNSITGLVNSTIDDTENILIQFLCPPIYTAWNDAVNQGTCTTFANGLYQLWIIHIITCWSLFFALISGFMFYELFDPTLSRVKNSKNDIEEEEEEQQEEHNNSEQLPSLSSSSLSNQIMKSSSSSQPNLPKTIIKNNELRESINVGIKSNEINKQVEIPVERNTSKNISCKNVGNIDSETKI